MKTFPKTILVIDDDEFFGSGPRVQILLPQITDWLGVAHPQWRAHLCYDLGFVGLKSFRDGAFSWVIVLQAERLTESLLRQIFCKLAQDGRVVLVYENVPAALAAPYYVKEHVWNDRCVLAHAHDHTSWDAVSLREVRRFLES